MTEEGRKYGSHGTSPCFLLFLLFFGLKLSGVLDWSWWWVFSPYWIFAAAISACCCAIGFLRLLEKWLGDDR